MIKKGLRLPEFSRAKENPAWYSGLHEGLGGYEEGYEKLVCFYGFIMQDEP